MIRQINAEISKVEAQLWSTVFKADENWNFQSEVENTEFLDISFSRVGSYFDVFLLECKNHNKKKSIC